MKTYAHTTLIGAGLDLESLASGVCGYWRVDGSHALGLSGGGVDRCAPQPAGEFGGSSSGVEGGGWSSTQLHYYGGCLQLLTTPTLVAYFL